LGDILIYANRKSYGQNSGDNFSVYRIGELDGISGTDKPQVAAITDGIICTIKSSEITCDDTHDNESYLGIIYLVHQTIQVRFTLFDEPLLSQLNQV
jgi:hypothetical protein